jgi:hypothetical protein
VHGLLAGSFFHQVLPLLCWGRCSPLLFRQPPILTITPKAISLVLDLVSQGRDVVLMSVHLDLGNPGGSGFWDEVYMSKGREMESLVYEQPGNEVDGSYHSKEGSK